MTAEREGGMSMSTTPKYETKAREVAQAIWLEVTATRQYRGCPKWGQSKRREGMGCLECGGVHGHHYRVTLRKRVPAPRWNASPVMSFDYWDSFANVAQDKCPGYYDILACVGSDLNMPTDPDEVVAEFGDMKPSQAIAIAKHAALLQTFFTAFERERLAEIQ